MIEVLLLAAGTEVFLAEQSNHHGILQFPNLSKRCQKLIRTGGLTSYHLSK